jgi:spermidine synthase
MIEDGPEVIARAGGVLGEVVLRRRPGPVHELIVNGVFLMDTAETTTERLLARLVRDRHPAPRRVLVGGLGLGCTLAELLADPRVERVDVVEIEPLLVEWLRAGLVPGADRVLADPRVHVRIADVRQVLHQDPPSYTERGQSGAKIRPLSGKVREEQPAGGYVYDAVVLDVDNGPGFLVHDQNAAVYEPAALTAAARVLRPPGLLVVWSADRAPALQAALAAYVGPTEQVVRRVERQGRALDYYLYVAAKQDIA